MKSMKNLKSLNWKKMVRRALAQVPEIPYINEKRSSFIPAVLGMIGVAALGGIAALMFLSPRTRTRALGAAKDTYNKVHDQIGNSAIGQRLGVTPVQNGYASQDNQSYAEGL